MLTQNQKDRIVKAYLRASGTGITLAQLDQAIAANNPLRNLTRKLAKTDDLVAQKVRYEDALVAALNLLRGYDQLVADMTDGGALDLGYSQGNRAEINAAYRAQQLSQAAALNLPEPPQDPDDTNE